MFCPKCGNEVKEDATFCGKCGHKKGEKLIVGDEVNQEGILQKYDVKLIVVNLFLAIGFFAPILNIRDMIYRAMEYEDLDFLRGITNISLKGLVGLYDKVVRFVVMMEGEIPYELEQLRYIKLLYIIVILAVGVIAYEIWRNTKKGAERKSPILHMITIINSILCMLISWELFFAYRITNGSLEFHLGLGIGCYILMIASLLGIVYVIRNSRKPGVWCTLVVSLLWGVLLVNLYVGCALNDGYTVYISREMLFSAIIFLDVTKFVPALILYIKERKPWVSALIPSVCSVLMISLFCSSFYRNNDVGLTMIICTTIATMVMIVLISLRHRLKKILIYPYLLLMPYISMIILNLEKSEEVSYMWYSSDYAFIWNELSAHMGTYLLFAGIFLVGIYFIISKDYEAFRADKNQASNIQ